MATRTEKVRAGAFLIGAVFLLIGILAFIGYLQFQKEGTQYHSVFNEVNNLSKGAPVKYNGVEIGEVSKISFAEKGTPPRIRVAYRIQEPRLITSSTVAHLGFLNPLSGTQYVSLTASEKKISAGKKLDAGSKIPSQASEIQETFGAVKESLDELNKLLQSNREKFSQLLTNSNRMVKDLHTLFRGPRQRENIREGSLLHLMQNIENVVVELRQTSETVRAAVEQSKPDILSIVKDTRKTAERLRTIAGEAEISAKVIRERLDSKEFQTVMTHIEELAANSASVSKKLNKVSAELDRTVQENQPDLQRIIRDLRKTGDNLKELSRKLRRRPSAILKTGQQNKRRIPQ